MPGYAYVNAVARVSLTKGLSLSINANNLFDTIGVTEVEGNGNIAGGLAAARTNYWSLYNNDITVSFLNTFLSF